MKISALLLAGLVAVPAFAQEPADTSFVFTDIIRYMLVLRRNIVL